MEGLVCFSKYNGFHPEAVKGLKQKSIVNRSVFKKRLISRVGN